MLRRDGLVSPNPVSEFIEAITPSAGLIGVRAGLQSYEEKSTVSTSNTWPVWAINTCVAIPRHFPSILNDVGHGLRWKLSMMNQSGLRDEEGDG